MNEDKKGQMSEPVAPVGGDSRPAGGIVEGSGGKPSTSAAPVQREVLLSWKAPQRYFSPIDRKKFWLVAACVLAFFVVLFLVGQYFLMLAIAAVMFLVYVVGTVPPVDVTHTLTTLGVETVGGVYEWSVLRGYWFCRRDKQAILNVDTSLRFPGRIIMLVKDADVKAVNTVMLKKLPYIDLRKQGRVRKVVDGEWVAPANL